MEAKDTVMSDEQIADTYCGMAKYVDITQRLTARAQAGISFKAGQEEEYKKWIKACMGVGMLLSEPEQLVNLHKAGIREVMVELSKLAIASGDLNLQSYVVGLLEALTEKYGKPN